MIIKAPNPLLTTPAKKVKKLDKKVLQVIEKLDQILVRSNKPKGVGLAAPQIGISLAIFIAKPYTESPVEVFINPEIVWQSMEMAFIKRKKSSSNKSIKSAKKLEGCLSIPNVWGRLKRPEKVRLRYMDLNGKQKEKEFEGFMATIVQHEVDHLNGILFTQRVLEQEEKLYRIEEDEKGEEKLVEVEI